MARYMQVAVLLAALCAVDVLTAATGADGDASGAPRGADVAKTSSPSAPSGDPAGAGEASGEADADHVRDKRRLPDPGFIIPATPMGFSKNGQPAQQEQPQAARSERQPTPSTPAQAERKTSSSAPSASSAPAQSSRGSFSFTDSVAAQSRQKKAPALHKHGKPAPGSREAPLGRAEHVRALTSFLEQTRKLGVPDEQALKLLDKELAKAKRQGPAYRPVYHATPLKPYGALINFNQAPYEKHQLKGMKPIKEQQYDIPPPTKPIVVESDRQILGAKATPSPAPIPGQHTEALVTPNGPLRVSVPKQIEPQHLLQPSQKFNPVQLSSPQIISGPLSDPQHSYQTISLPVASYKQEETYQTLQSLDHSQYLQTAPIEHATDSETPVSLDAVHSYPAPEQHIISAPLQHEHVVSTVASPQVTVEEVHKPYPVYVYRQEEVKIPEPQVHVEVPAAPVLTKQVIHEPDHQGGLYHDQKEHPEEYASQYRFGYRVRDQHAGNDFGHAETRDGKMTKGEYFVSLPDGRLQSVKYWADQGGYHAQISYTHHAVHPAHPAHPAHHTPAH